MVTKEQTNAQIKEIQADLQRAIEELDGQSSGTSELLRSAQTRLDTLLSSQPSICPQPSTAEGEYEREVYLAGLVNYVHDAIVATDEQLKIVAWNRAAEELYGWKAAEVIGRNVYEVIPSSFDARDHEHAQQVLAETGHFETILTQYTRDGRPLEIESRGMIVRDPDGRVSGFVSVNRDLTSHQQVENALRESRERLLLATGAAKIGTWDSNLLTGELTFDPRARQITGFQDGEPHNLDQFLQAVHPEDREMVIHHIRQTEENGLPYAQEYRIIGADNVTRWVYARGQAYTDGTGRLARMMGVIMDMTQRQQVAANTRKALAQSEVQHRLMDQRERERLSIARDLHDGPVQDLIAISFGLQTAALETADPAQAETLEALRDAIHEVVTSLRNYAGELRPPALAKFGLEKAVRSHVEGFREKHPEIHLTLQMHQTGPLTPEPVRLALYRIYQEAMNNIVRHSQASEVVIRFEKDEQVAEFEIQDNGRGFTLPEDWLDLAREGHLGLVGIQERAEAVGGTASFTSQPGQGTTVRVRIPILDPGPRTAVGL